MILEEAEKITAEEGPKWLGNEVLRILPSTNKEFLTKMHLYLDTISHFLQSPYDQDSAYWSPSPWGTGSWDRATAGRDRSKERKEGSIGWQGFPKPDLPTYSSLERNPDDFNPFQTHAHREEAIGLRRSQERDESVKFYGYGDHRVSGLEMKPKRWQGGEVFTTIPRD
jgi:hypothetical protein